MGHSNKSEDATKAQRHEDIFKHELTQNNGEKAKGKRRKEAGSKGAEENRRKREISK